MSTKLAFSDKSPIPAGLFSGIEAFWYDGEKWVIAQGKVQRFHDAPSAVQQQILKLFMVDKKSLSYLSKIGINEFSKSFDTWYKCVIGGLDSIPDFLGDKFTPDTYNNMCLNYQCSHRGKLCSLAAGLKNSEVETLVALKAGKTMELTASDLCVSLPGIKSRIEKIRDKLQAPNIASLMVKTVELGI